MNNNTFIHTIARAALTLTLALLSNTTAWASFDGMYIDENGEKVLPYILHRTSLGCYERTLTYLLEEYAGALPTWMAPSDWSV